MSTKYKCKNLVWLCYGRKHPKNQWGKHTRTRNCNKCSKLGKHKTGNYVVCKFWAYSRDKFKNHHEIHHSMYHQTLTIKPIQQETKNYKIISFDHHHESKHIFIMSTIYTNNELKNPLYTRDNKHQFNIGRIINVDHIHSQVDVCIVKYLSSDITTKHSIHYEKLIIPLHNNAATLKLLVFGYIHHTQKIVPPVIVDICYNYYFTKQNKDNHLDENDKINKNDYEGNVIRYRYDIWILNMQCDIIQRIRSCMLKRLKYSKHQLNQLYRYNKIVQLILKYEKDTDIKHTDLKLQNKKIAQTIVNNIGIDYWNVFKELHKYFKYSANIPKDFCMYQPDAMYPIYVCDKLKLSKHWNNILIHSLRQIGELNNDYRPNAPILNIIDPELYCYRLNRNIYMEIIKKKIMDRYEWYSDDSDKESNQEWLANLKEKETKGLFLRGTYQWLSTVFKIDEQTLKVKIVSPIHNIQPRPKYEELYCAIEHVFQSMLPLLKQFQVFKKWCNNFDEIQVIVKSQSYILKPRTGYKGTWHTEGLTENIAYVGIYFWEWDKQLSGGDLIFRQKRERESYESQTWVSLMEGSCVVFDNFELVHKVQTLKNISDKIQHIRSFLAFFVVDPNKPIKSTKDIYTLKREDYVLIVHDITNLDMNISILICEYAKLGMTLGEAKKFRNDIIDLKMKTEGKFNYVHFGNWGNYIYLPMNKLLNFKRDVQDSGHISHLHSDLEFEYCHTETDYADTSTNEEVEK
eukprot:466865_1